MLGFLKSKTTERKVADTIHEVAVSVRLCGGEQYDVPAPTLATLVEVSALSSELSPSEGSEVTLQTMLHSAQDAAVYARMLSAFILGVRRDNAKAREELCYHLMERASVSEVIEAVQSILSSSDIGGLFMLTTSLREMRLTKPTREVVTPPTALGQE